MKAFIVAAFLVASVAAQSMDLMDLVRPTHHRRSMSTVEDLLLKEKLGGRRHLVDYPTWNKDSSIYDVEDLSTVFGGRRGGVSVLSLEELVSHPIFREYLRIPLFRQFWEEHPVVFRRYVESPLFQKFWKVPEFQMYFRNPVFFYKYIVPQVQYIAETVVPTTTEGIFDYGTTSRFNPYNTFAYTPRVNREWSVPMSTYGMRYPTTTPTTHYKYLLEKMMNHMNMNKMGQDLTETLTDVKMLPNGHIKEQTFGKIVDPITGLEKITVGDVKLVDEKIVPVQGMEFPLGFEGMTKEYPMNKVFGHRNIQTLKNILLKHIILNKIFGDRKVITPEVYRELFSEHKEVFPEMYNKIFKNRNVMLPEVLETVFGENKRVLSPEVFETLFSTKKTFTPEIFDTLFGEHKRVLTPELIEILLKGNKHIMTPKILADVFGKKVYSPEVYGKLFGGEDKMMINSEEELYPLNKYTNVEYEPFTYNKVNRFAVNPIVSRMLKNSFLPKMNVEKFETEKMIEEIQKEKIMSHLLKNREHSTRYMSVEDELPTFTSEEKMMRHIPLTYGKPLRGSSIEEILREKEIKY